MKRIASTIAIILCISLIFTGCSTGSANNSSSKNIKIGAEFSLTGNIAIYGTSSLNGIKMAVDEINKKGGIKGKKIVLDTADTKSDASEATNQASRLIVKDRVVGMLGPESSGMAQAAMAIATQNKVPMIATTATNPEVTFDSKTNRVRNYIFRASFKDSVQGMVAAKFLKDNLAKKNVAILISSNDSYSIGLAQYFEKQFKSMGGKIVDKEYFTSGDKDFNSVLTKIKTKNPEAIYVPAYYNDVGVIVKQARDLGITAPMVGGDGWDSPELVKIAGPDALNNTYFTNHYVTSDPDQKIQDFVKKYKDKYGSDPEAFAAVSYDATYLLAKAIENAKSTSGEDIKKAIENISGFEGVTGSLSYDSHHDSVKSVTIVEMKDGKQTLNTKIDSKDLQ